MPRAPSLPQRLRRELQDMGGSADGVAATLLNAGITGVKQDARRCPVASYIKARFGCDRVVAGYSNVFVTPPHKRTGKAATPKPIQDFMGMFDNGFYAQLEARNEEDQP